MKNKKLWIILGAALLIALLVILLESKPAGETVDPAAETAEDAAETTGEDAVKAPEPDAKTQETEPADDEAQPGEQSQEGESEGGAQLIEDEGDIIIIIPDDEESDGF